MAYRDVPGLGALYLNTLGTTLPGESDAPPQPELIDKAQKLYNKLETDITTSMEEAKKQGKPLVITFGDDHLDRGSMLADVLILKIAKDKGIKVMAVEAKPELLNTLRMRYQNGDSIPMHVPEIVGLADRNQMKVIPADDHVLPLAEREAIMVGAIKNMHEPAIFLMGANHMETMANNKELSGQYVVRFDVSNTTPLKIKGYAEQGMLGQAAKSSLLNLDPNVKHYEMGDEFSHLSKASVLAIAAQVSGDKTLPGILREKPDMLFIDQIVEGGLPRLSPPVNSGEPIGSHQTDREKEIRANFEVLRKDVSQNLFGGDSDKRVASKMAEHMLYATVAMDVADWNQAKLLLNSALQEFDKEFPKPDAVATDIRKRLSKTIEDIQGLQKTTPSVNHVNPNETPSEAIIRTKFEQVREQMHEKVFGGSYDKEAGNETSDLMFSASNMMDIGDWKQAEDYLKKAVGRFDKDFPTPDAEVRDVKMKLLATIDSVHTHNNPEKAQEKAPPAPPKAPVQQLKR